MSYRPSSGPITITVREGMVVVAEKTYEDARQAYYRAFRRGPKWLTRALLSTGMYDKRNREAA